MPSGQIQHGRGVPAAQQAGQRCRPGRARRDERQGADGSSEGLESFIPDLSQEASADAARS